jgi:hypothetical protein
LADAAHDILRPLTFQSLVLQQVDVVQVGRAFQSLHGWATTDAILVGQHLLHVFCTLVYIHIHQVLLVIPVWLRSLVIQLKASVLADLRARTTIMLLVSRFLEHSASLVTSITTWHLDHRIGYIHLHLVQLSVSQEEFCLFDDYKISWHWPAAH